MRGGYAVLCVSVNGRMTTLLSGSSASYLAVRQVTYRPPQNSPPELLSGEALGGRLRRRGLATWTGWTRSRNAGFRRLSETISPCPI